MWKKIKQICCCFWLHRQNFNHFASNNTSSFFASHATVFWAPVGIASAGFTIVFSLTTGIIKKLLSIPRNKTRKQDKILMLAKCKLNSIETLVSQALIDTEISHKELLQFQMRDKYKMMAETLRNVSENKKIWH